MSFAVVPKEGGIYLNRCALRDPEVQSDVWYLRLAKNNFTVSMNTVLAGFTECDASGYDEVELDPLIWFPPVTITNLAVSYYGNSPILFQGTGANQTVYGYYVANGSVNVIWYQKFDSPLTIGASQLPVSVGPIFRAVSGFVPP